MDLHTALITIITFSAVISVLVFAFSLLLNPVKKDIEIIKEGQAEMKAEIKEIKALITAKQN